MSSSKQGYFQGTEEPKPHKKQYKSEPTKPVQTRFKEPFYRNYDLYETEGVDGKPKLGPGKGLYQNLDKYKSVKEFIDKSRKRNKNKYKADADDANDKSSRSKRSFRRMQLLKIAIDFPIDDQINSPILGDGGTVSNSNQIGFMDPYTTQNDFEGKSPDQLDIGRDYTENEEPDEDLDLEALLDKYLTPAEPPIYGLPDGISPPEDLDAPSNENPWYGTTDSGNTLYEDKWNI